ncbi:MAG: DUF2793 domain-containing protein [Hoeflea sp.]|uniref:DUF2793 domain-containing protein n=1 Tax=Hoeflea sp. TaxID=1940281 RepID=UPI0032978134
MGGRDQVLAIRQGNGWLYLEPKAGWRAYDLEASALYIFDGTGWTDALGEASVSTLAVNSVADNTNRLSIRSPASLFDHETGDHRIYVNKQAPADTASMLFQSGYSGKAEFGIAGDDALSLKVADENRTWRKAMTVAPASAHVGIGGLSDPQAPLHVLGDIRMSSNSAFIAFYDATDQARSGYLQVHKDHGYYFVCELAKPMMFYTSNQMRLFVGADGKIGIGGVIEPTTALHVGGPARVGAYQAATLPSASTNGAGAIIYVEDDPGGAVLAFSDGAVWRRVTDRAEVTP